MFSRSRFPPKGNDETQMNFDMVRGLVPSMVICKGLAILSSRIDVRETTILGMEAPGQLPGSSVWDWGPF